MVRCFDLPLWIQVAFHSYCLLCPFSHDTHGVGLATRVSLLTWIAESPWPGFCCVSWSSGATLTEIDLGCKWRRSSDIHGGMWSRKSADERSRARVKVKNELVSWHLVPGTSRILGMSRTKERNGAEKRHAAPLLWHTAPKNTSLVFYGQGLRRHTHTHLDLLKRFLAIVLVIDFWLRFHRGTVSNLRDSKIQRGQKHLHSSK